MVLLHFCGGVSVSILNPLKSDSGSFAASRQSFFVTVLAKLCQAGFLSGEYISNRRLAGDVLDIAAGECITLTKFAGVIIRDVLDHGLPDFAACQLQE